MVDQDPFGGVLYLTKLLGHNSAIYDRTLQKYHISKDRWSTLLVNGIIFLILNSFYLWNSLSALEERFRVFGTTLALLLILDSQLCFCWVYSMMFNGIQNANLCLRLLNRHLNVRNKMSRELGKPDKCKNNRIINGWIVLNFIYNFLSTLSYQMVVFYDEISWPDWTVTVIFMVIAIVTYNYLIKFNAFLIALRADLDFVGESTKRALLQSCEITVQSEIYFELLSIMTLIMQVYSLPIVFWIVLVFFEGTVQWFQVYIIAANGKYKKIYLLEAITYAFWLWPMMVMLLATMGIAGSTSQKVSCLYTISNKMNIGCLEMAVFITSIEKFA